MSPEVAALLSQIDLLGKDIALADAPEKQAKLRAAALNLSAALEPDSDIVERISFQASTTYRGSENHPLT